MGVRSNISFICILIVIFGGNVRAQTSLPTHLRTFNPAVEAFVRKIEPVQGQANLAFWGLRYSGQGNVASYGQNRCPQLTLELERYLKTKLVDARPQTRMSVRDVTSDNLRRSLSPGSSTEITGEPEDRRYVEGSWIDYQDYVTVTFSLKDGRAQVIASEQIQIPKSQLQSYRTCLNEPGLQRFESCAWVDQVRANARIKIPRLNGRTCRGDIRCSAILAGTSGRQIRTNVFFENQEFSLYNFGETNCSNLDIVDRYFPGQRRAPVQPNNSGGVR